ncbi:MAG TPA: ATP-binding protein [Actinomycetota bacterium]
MSAKLRWYVGTLYVAGGLVLAFLLPQLDQERAREVAGAIALFAAFMILGELVTLRVDDQNRLKEVSITSAFAYGLVPLAGTTVAVVVFILGSVVADLTRRRGLVKTLFNAAQYVLALAAGGAVYHALGGGYEITTETLPALAAGGVAFMLVNFLLVSIVVSLANDMPILQGLRRDNLRLELGSSAMVLALAPVAVVVAERSLLLLPALVVPLGAVFLASKGEIRARAQQAVAEEAAELQRRLTRQEHEVVSRLQEADRLKADLIAAVSHELRNPLTTIVGVFGILRVRRDRLSQAERDELVLMGIDQSERLHHMIEQLLTAARFEQPEGVASLGASRAELDATDLIRQAGAEARARHQDRRIAIETNGALPVRVARDAVVQVLGNLLDNACKYSPDGEPVRLSGNREGAEAVLVVQDAGPGIPEAERQRIFDRFTQLERHRQRRDGGVGLGLYIARQLALSQDGDLLVVDPPGGHGARFELHLPLVPEAAGS